MLFVLFWVRCSSVSARVDDFGEYARLLADQLTSAREQFPYEAAATETGGGTARPEPAEFDGLHQRVADFSADAAAVGDLVDREVGWLRWAAGERRGQAGCGRSPEPRRARTAPQGDRH